MLAVETVDREAEVRLLVSLREAARIWSASYWSVVDWVRQGRIKTVKLSRRRMVPMSEVKRVAEEGI